MRSIKTVFFITFACAVMWSCGKSDEQQTPGGYKFNYIERGDGNVVKPGEILIIDMAIVDQGDSVYYDNRVTDYPEMVKIADESRIGTEHGVTEVFRFLSKGDSILFFMPAKTFFPVVWKTTPPEGMSDNHLFTFQIKVREIMDEPSAMEFQMKADSLHEAKEAVRTAAYDQQQIAKDTVIIDNYLEGKNMKAIALPSGIRYIVKGIGAGRTIKNGDVVSMKYAGQNLDGSEFDSGEYTYTVGSREVIRGWDEIALVMKPGTSLTVFIPSTMAYGAGGRPPVIMPDAILIFDMEVLSVKEGN
jgi:FKBP-type peptidyl-prolyl cis-trans isomerase